MFYQDTMDPSRVIKPLRQEKGSTICAFPGSEYTPPKQQKKPQPAKKPDKQVCIKCSLHAKNPASATSECAHEYPQ